MSNYIKIPLANNPARSLVTGTGSLTASITTNSSDATNQTATNTAFTTSGTGTGATVQLTISGNAVTVASTTVAGEGFKVGDTLTFDKSVIGGTTDVVITLVADDLVTSSGSDTEPFFLMPIDNVGAVVKGSNNTTCIVELKQANATGTGADKVAKYTITVDDVPATDKWALQADVAAAVIKAASAENAQPEVKFTGGAECLTVVLS